MRYIHCETPTMSSRYHNANPVTRFAVRAAKEILALLTPSVRDDALPNKT